MSAPLSLCVINCEDNDHGACVPELYQAAFGTGDPTKERWTIVETAKTGELPSGSFDAIFLTGSHLNVEDALPWMDKLCEFLRQQLQREDSDEAQPRIVGCCFGAQIIAHAFGGEVAPNPGGRYVLRLEDISPTSAWAALPSAGGLVRAAADGSAAPCAPPDPPTSTALPLFITAPLPEGLEGAGGPDVPAASSAAATGGSGGGGGQLRGIESHGFCVSRLPPGAVLLGSSPSCAHEAFALGRNVLALQCHPEFDLGVVAGKLWPGLVEQRRRLSAAEAADARASFTRATNNAALRDFVRAFCGIA